MPIEKLRETIQYARVQVAISLVVLVVEGGRNSNGEVDTVKAGGRGSVLKLVDPDGTPTSNSMLLLVWVPFGPPNHLTSELVSGGEDAEPGHGGTVQKLVDAVAGVSSHQREPTK